MGGHDPQPKDLPDGKLYFNIRAPGNIVLAPDTHANISRINPDGTGFEYVARARALRAAPEWGGRCHFGRGVGARG